MLDDDDLVLLAAISEYEDERIRRIRALGAAKAAEGEVFPANAYIIEDASQFYITEDASSVYVTEA